MLKRSSGQCFSILAQDQDYPNKPYRPTDFRGMKVLVVGFSNSAADISSELVGHAGKILVSNRRRVNVVSVVFHLSLESDSVL